VSLGQQPEKRRQVGLSIVVAHIQEDCHSIV